MKEANMRWYHFECNSCGWKTPGTYDWETPRTWLLPDTDCPKCGAHDSVLGGEREVPAPANLDAVREDINSGPYLRTSPP